VNNLPEPGTTLEPNAIESAIGAGGTGKAHPSAETRLVRKVAAQTLIDG
jgi:hypothetical protein